MQTFRYIGGFLCTVMILCTLPSCENNEKELAQPGEILKGNELPAHSFPKIRFVDSADEAGRTSDFSDPEAFDFSEDPDGVTFSSSAGVTFEESPEGGHFVVDVQTLQQGGGVMTAGNRRYDIDVAFCFSADDDFLDFTDEQGNEIGVSGVVGISGFDKVKNLEDLDGAESFVDAVVYLIVFDENAQGAYNAYDIQSEDIDGEEQIALAVVVDVQNEVLYSASRGTVNVASNTMAFDGYFHEYFGEGAEVVREVSGSGTLGCQ